MTFHKDLDKWSDFLGNTTITTPILDCLIHHSEIIKSITRKEKTESLSKPYDLTTLQRKENRLFDFTAQQTLNYLLALYKKRFSAHSRTDSRYLTEHMSVGLPTFCEIVDSTLPFVECMPFPVNAAQMTDSSKVSAHHAVIPTVEIAAADFAALPSGERNILNLISFRLLRAVAESHICAENAATLNCGGVL